ncbi:hypothetical protein P3T73_18405 [Kiritimatiellota bacterium B12222]|nr:hypothetical protein P3T73_18405 [Kiritimatiellota bacterium B12222]
MKNRTTPFLCLVLLLWGNRVLLAEEFLIIAPPEAVPDIEELVEENEVVELIEEAEQEGEMSKAEAEAEIAKESDAVVDYDLPSEIVENAIEAEVLTAENTGVMVMDLEEEVTWIDSTHNWLYGKSQNTVVWLDTRFIPKDQELVPTPPSRFRVGLAMEFDLKTDGIIKISPDFDFHSDIELPNLEKSLKVFISTKDPTAAPGEGPLNSDTSLRVGASSDFMKNWKASAGVKTKWPPEPFAYVIWSPEYMLGEHWSVIPQVKPFWESEDGFGGLTSLLFNRWRHRMMYRQALSLKWTQDQEKQDKENAADMDSYQYGSDGGGYSWDSTTVIGYASQLLKPDDYGKRIGADEVARGTGIKVQVTGNEVATLKAELTLFLKGPLYKDFVYYIIGPSVNWADENDWDEEYTAKIGFEMLLWGDEKYQ